MATLIPGRLPRRVPAGGLYVAAVDAIIPEGSVVGVSHDLIHKNADIFEEPHEFRPERWMGEAGKERLHWLVSFSWGRTDCIGKKYVRECPFPWRLPFADRLADHVSCSLAYAEMHLMLANLFSHFHLELLPDADEVMVWEDRVIMHPHGFLHVKAKRRTPAAP